MDPKSPSKLKLSTTGSARNKWVFKICIGSLVVGLILFAAFLGFKPGYAGDLAGRNYYTVVVDCGSTGTRVNVYEWNAGNLGIQDLPALMHSYPDNSSESFFSSGSCKYHCLQTEPGLDKVVGNATGVRILLEPLIFWAEQWVPRARHGETPIFVLATAGLRKLSIEDAHQVLNDVENVVKKHSFAYMRSWIRVLSGKEEAYYGWLSLNYRMGSLGNSSRGSTLGLVDLGGSSLQVVMEVDGDPRDDANLIRSKVGPIEHQILAYSLRSFGLNEAFDRTIEMLLRVHSDNEISESDGRPIKLRHPCLSPDFAQNYSCPACNGPNTLNSKNVNGQVHRSRNIYLVGDPDWELCKKIAAAAAINSSTLDWVQPKLGTGCKSSLNSSGSHNILDFPDDTHLTGSFHALSGFFAVYNMLNLTPRANLTKIWVKGRQLCSNSWAGTGSLPRNWNDIGQYCFQVPYMVSLIEDGLCLGNKEIHFGPGDISWTLGASLVEARDLWLSTAKISISSHKNMRAIYSSIFVFLLLLCISFIVYCSQIKLPMPGRRAPPMGPSKASYISLKRMPR